MKTDPEVYLEALGKLPQLGAARLTAIRSVFDSWLSLQHQLQNLDRYHLHESPKALEKDFQGQVEEAFKAIQGLERTLETLEAAHMVYHRACKAESEMKDRLKSMPRPKAGELMAGGA